MRPDACQREAPHIKILVQFASGTIAVLIHWNSEQVTNVRADHEIVEAFFKDRSKADGEFAVASGDSRHAGDID